MYSRVLVASDFSAASDLVIRSATKLRDLGAREVTLVHCLFMPLTHDPVQDRRLAANLLEDQASRFKEAGFEPVDTRLLEGRPEQKIPEAAADHDLVVLGSRGGNLAAEFFLGSTTSRILQETPLPVFLVNIKVEDKSPALPDPVKGDNLLSRVLLPTDFSRPADEVLNLVEQWPAESMETLCLLHVMRESDNPDELANTREEMEQRKAQLPEGIREKTQIEVRSGAPITEILRAARTYRTTLIAMARQGHGLIHEVFIGGVSHQVARQAPCHVLLTST